MFGQKSYPALDLISQLTITEVMSRTSVEILAWMRPLAIGRLGISIAFLVWIPDS